mmetsp:Transcript_54417/g.100547  ORF Transcript_54417/g.100547 Transcript_54417/m.100547 type:complete len:336 (+) Transcript_54417:78-1085(+)
MAPHPPTGPPPPLPDLPHPEVKLDPRKAWNELPEQNPLPLFEAAVVPPPGLVPRHYGSTAPTPGKAGRGDSFCSACSEQECIESRAEVVIRRSGSDGALVPQMPDYAASDAEGSSPLSRWRSLTHLPRRRLRCRGLARLTVAVLLCILVVAALRFFLMDELSSIMNSSLSSEAPELGAAAPIEEARIVIWPMQTQRQHPAQVRRASTMQLRLCWTALRLRCWRGILAFTACTELLLCIQQPPPAGQMYAGIPLGGILCGRWGAAYLGMLGGIIGAAAGIMLGCTCGFLVGSVMAPASSEFVSRCFGGARAAKWVGYLPVALLPAVGLLAEFYRLW